MREIGGIVGSTKFAYKSLAYEYNKSIKNSRPKTYANIANGMDYTLTKKTPSIIIATTFTKNEAQLFKFANISKLLTAETKAILKVFGEHAYNLDSVIGAHSRDSNAKTTRCNLNK